MSVESLREKQLREEEEKLVAAYKIAAFARQIGIEDAEIISSLEDHMDLHPKQARGIVVRLNAQWN